MVTGQESDNDEQKNVSVTRSCKAILDVPSQEQESEGRRNTQPGGVEEASCSLFNELFTVVDLVNIQQKNTGCNKT
ncbi:hypothetical protein EHRUM4_08550 [Ehrlichia ruminantium]|nr:hypothetical protein [Ehrlichia ruminantium]GAT75631.1 hypothetical protein EHRUM4_08550 [Ehrlichia ruminantium]GAT77601.1 hypothetical protein EHRUM2_08280 [Ehrlichia ruminantium]